MRSAASLGKRLNNPVINLVLQHRLQQAAWPPVAADTVFPHPRARTQLHIFIAGDSWQRMLHYGVGLPILKFAGLPVQ